MTVIDNTPRDQYTATSGQTVFPYTFEISASGDIVVLQNGAILNEGTGAGQYGISGVGSDSGGNITLVTGATTGDVITLYRDMALDRLTSYTNGGDFLAADVNNDFDRLWLALQQNTGTSNRALVAPNTDPLDINMTIPDKDARRSKFLKFNSVTGNPEASNFPAGDFAASGMNIYSFTGDGATVNYTLGMEPGGDNNTQIYIDGVYQQKINYSVFGAIVTFSTAPPNLSSIEVMVIEALPVGNTTAPQVSFTQAGSTYNSNVQRKLEERVSVKDFGAIGDGATDDTVSIQAAIDSLSPFGGTVYFPTGIYAVSDAGASRCLFIEYPVSLLGEGANYSAIKPLDTVASTVNTIVISPNVGYALDFLTIEGLFLGNPSNATRKGATGIVLDTTTTGQFLPNFTLTKTYIAGGDTGYGLLHNSANNITGSLYESSIINNTIKSGIKLNDSGDSIQIYNNILSGDNIGVEASQIVGASLLSIIDNNITNDGGAIKVNRALRTHIMRNNIENLRAGATAQNNGAVININNANGTGTAGVISQNLVSIFGASDATTLVRLREERGTLVQDNTFLAGIGGVTAVDVALSQDVRINANTYNVGTVNSKITDTATATTGVKKNLTLVNSWVEYTTSETPKSFKDSNGVVHLEGTIKSGTTTYGTTLFTLPSGYAPPTGTLLRVGTYSLGGANAGVGRLEIDDSGTVTIADGGNTLLTLTGISFAADGFADSFTAE